MERCTLFSWRLPFSWCGDFKDAESNFELEANQMADLYRMAQAFPETFSTPIQDALNGYLTSILQNEFPAMAEGHESTTHLSSAAERVECVPGLGANRRQESGLL